MIGWLWAKIMRKLIITIVKRANKLYRPAMCGICCCMMKLTQLWKWKFSLINVCDIIVIVNVPSTTSKILNLCLGSSPLSCCISILLQMKLESRQIMKIGQDDRVCNPLANKPPWSFWLLQCWSQQIVFISWYYQTQSMSHNEDPLSALPDMPLSCKHTHTNYFLFTLVVPFNSTLSSPSLFCLKIMR